MSGERLAEIRTELDYPSQYALEFDAKEMARELLAEVERLWSERDKLGRKAVKRLAKQMADESRIKALNIRNGVAELEMDEARELCAAYVGAARAMLTGAENYSETRVDFEVKVAESPERYVLTVQRAGKLTPHEARQQAEAERDEARNLAQVSLDILRNVSDEPMRELFGVDDMGELPSWFTRYGGES